MGFLEIPLTVLLCMLFIQSSAFFIEQKSNIETIMNLSPEFYVIQVILVVHLFVIPGWIRHAGKRFAPEKGNASTLIIQEEQWINFFERSLYLIAGISGSYISLIIAMLVRILWLALFRRNQIALRLALAFFGIFSIVVFSRALFATAFLP
jgi:hypothetical protein